MQNNLSVSLLHRAVGRSKDINTAIETVLHTVLLPGAFGKGLIKKCLED